MRGRLLNSFDEMDVPKLLTRYARREVTLPDVITRLKKLSDSFELYRQRLTENFKENNGGELPKEVGPAINEMRKLFRNGMFALQKKMFPLLRKEALEVRLLKIEETAKLLDRHRYQPGEKMDPNLELERLGNDLACLFYYPVGPAFDKIKGNSLAALHPTALAP